MVFFKVSGEDLIFKDLVYFSYLRRETTLTISVAPCGPVSVESEIMRVISLCTTEISEITRQKSDHQSPDTFQQEKKMEKVDR